MMIVVHGSIVRTVLTSFKMYRHCHTPFLNQIFSNPKCSRATQETG